MRFAVIGKNCPECGTGFSCGRDHETGACWCDRLPAILPPTPGLECLCEKCLVIRLRSPVAAYIAAIPPERRRQSEAMRHAAPGPLVEGLDFYRENGYTVFTEWHHLKRGECCGNGCRHCPYPQPASHR